MPHLCHLGGRRSDGDGALEPIVRKEPEQWLGAIGALAGRREQVGAAGRRHRHRSSANEAARPTPLAAWNWPSGCYPTRSRTSRRAVSFAIRLCARGEIEPVRDFLARHVPPGDSAATWVLCDAIRSMTKKFLPEFAPLLPLYEQWAADPALSAKDRRSVESAVKTLRK